ncbi:YdcF family protein [uncultured Fusobacterium sp.]|uniref:YdcF family protein n=1 Tax=uncultured Fusobacterium sp. TaxID=159267 RepID=UPI00260FC511|nr:YdcF family protein [uncultured Fusobacterium sp.]
MRKKIAVIFLLVMTVVIFKNLGEYLVLNEKPERVDAIVVYSGDSGERTVKGVELLKDGYAEKIIFSGGAVYDNVRMADLMEAHAIKLGVDPNKIIKDREAGTTYENALFTRDLLEANGYKKIILVTSNYHSRRSYLTTKKVFEGSRIDIITVASNDEFSSSWWRSGRSLLILINEYAKIVGYYFQGKI